MSSQQVARADRFARRHVDRLNQLGLLDWRALCEPRSSKLDDDEFAEAKEEFADNAHLLPYENVFDAGLPLRADDTVLLSNGRCYSRTGMLKWIDTFAQRTVRPQFPDTRVDLQPSDYAVLEVPQQQAGGLVDRPSLQTTVAAADRGDQGAQRALRAEQHAVFVARGEHQQHEQDGDDYVEPLDANEPHRWFRRMREEPGTVERLLAGKPEGAFIVLWSPDSDARGSLAYVARRDDGSVHIGRAALNYSPEQGYSSPDVAFLRGRQANVQRPPRYLSLTQLLLQRPTLRWPRDALPFDGYVGAQVNAERAGNMLWNRPVGTYLVRRSSRDPHQLVVAFRDRNRITNLPVVIHDDQSATGARGFAGDGDRRGHTTLASYLGSLQRTNDIVLPTTPL